MGNKRNNFKKICENTSKISFNGDSALQLFFNFSIETEAKYKKELIIENIDMFDKNNTIFTNGIENYFSKDKIDTCHTLQIFTTKEILKKYNIFIFENEMSMFYRLLNNSCWNISAKEDYIKDYLFLIGNECGDNALLKDFKDLPQKVSDILIAKDIVNSLKKISDYNISNEMIFFSKDILHIPMNLIMSDISHVKYYSKFLELGVHSDEEKRRLFISALYSYLYNVTQKDRIKQLFLSFDDIILNYTASIALFYQKFDLFEIKMRFDNSFSDIRKKASSTLSNIKGVVILMISSIVALPTLGIPINSLSVLKNILFFIGFFVVGFLYRFLIGEDINTINNIDKNVDDIKLELDKGLFLDKNERLTDNQFNLKEDEYLKKIYEQIHSLKNEFKVKIEILKFCKVIIWIPTILFFLNLVKLFFLNKYFIDNIIY